MTEHCRLKNGWGITKNVKIYTLFYLKFQIFNWWLPSWCILTCYRYTDSWTINRNRAALYPLPTFTNMLTVDKPTAMEQLYISYSVSLKKTVWHVPGTLWHPGKCQADDVLNFSFTSVRDRKLFHCCWFVNCQHVCKCWCLTLCEGPVFISAYVSQFHNFSFMFLHHQRVKMR